MKHKYFQSLVGHEFVETHYVEWGDESSKDVVCCVHGLTRNARDFDFLAKALCKDFRVACIDVAGRGSSAALIDPTFYSNQFYVSQMTAWLANLNARSVFWVGTSMGGILGMVLASAKNSPIQKLVISDVGFRIPKDALNEIGDYVGKPVSFKDLNSAEKYFRSVYAGFGDLSGEQWRHLTQHGLVKDGESWMPNYDPAIKIPFEYFEEDVDLSIYWDEVSCPTLLFRGENSSLLPREYALQMASKKSVRLIEIPNTGHAPMMMDDEQICAIKKFLIDPDAKVV